MFTKAKIFDLAANALLLTRRFIDPDTDKSNEAKVFLTNYDIALRSTLEDLDLDSTSDVKTLELVEEDPNDQWLFAYKYPSNCAIFRRIQSTELMDNRYSHIPRRIGMYEGQKVIFTNEADAIAEYVAYDVPLSSLSANAGLAVAYKLATLSAPLITGKGAQKLIEAIQAKYIVAKAEAQEKDKNENFNYVEDHISSEFVAARTS